MQTQLADQMQVSTMQNQFKNNYSMEERNKMYVKNTSSELQNLYAKQNYLLQALKAEHDNESEFQQELKMSQIKILDFSMLHQRGEVEAQTERKSPEMSSVAKPRITSALGLVNKEAEDHIKASPRIQNAKEGFFIKRLSMNIQRLQHLIKNRKDSNKRKKKIAAQKAINNLPYKMLTGDTKLDGGRHSVPSLPSLTGYQTGGAYQTPDNRTQRSGYGKSLQIDPRFDKKLGSHLASKLVTHSVNKQFKDKIRASSYGSAQNIIEKATIEASTGQYFDTYGLNTIQATSTKTPTRLKVTQQNNLGAQQLVSQLNESFNFPYGSNQQIQITNNNGYLKSTINNSKSVANLNSLDNERSFSTLVVNKQPDIPLKVPLDKAGSPLSARADQMKSKNLERYENVALNLKLKAEQERHQYLQKMKKKIKALQDVERTYRTEADLYRNEVTNKRAKHQAVIMNRKHIENQNEYKSLKHFQQHKQKMKKTAETALSMPVSPSQWRQRDEMLKSALDSDNVYLTTIDDSTLRQPKTNKKILIDAKKVEKEEAMEVKQHLNAVNDKLLKSNRYQQEKLEEIKHHKSYYNSKVLDAVHENEKRIINQNSQIGEYVLSNNLDNDLYEKDRQGKNMRDFVIMDKVQKNVQKANIQLKQKQDKLIFKNEHRFKEKNARSQIIEKEKNFYRSQLDQKLENEKMKIKIKALNQVEEAAVKREMNQLRKADQQLNFDRLKKERQEKMLQLQAKHYLFDARNKLNQISHEHSQKKNMLLEQIKKKELSTNHGQTGTTYKIKPQKHLDEVSSMMDKLQSVNGGQPRGLKAISSIRQPA